MKRPDPTQINRRRYDLIIVGGGINGAAIARDAAMRGLSVLLLEKRDFGSGTSSWSTRLIHGGLRYLEHREFGLVRESLRERQLLLQHAPHLVKPLSLVLPIYAGARRGPHTIRVGLTLYDLLSAGKSLPRHRMLDRADALRALPWLEPANLEAAAQYFDAQVTFPERLVIELAISAAEHGAFLLNYARVDAIEGVGSAVTGIRYTDLLTGRTHAVAGRTIANVTGPWVDQLLESANPGTNQRLLGGTKGSHIVVDRQADQIHEAIYYEARSDGRAIFVVPWNGYLLIGTTDLRYEGDLDDVRPDQAEIDYLLRETNQLLPALRLTPADIVFSYAGVRPLPFTGSGAEAGISRRHLVIDHAPGHRGLFSIVGGKLTTHRSLAEEAVDRIVSALGLRSPAQTASISLPGTAGVAFAPFANHVMARRDFSTATLHRLVSLYGVRAVDILTLACSDPGLRDPLGDAGDALAAEIPFALEHEQAVTLEDILLRRTMLGYQPDMGLATAEAAAGVAVRQGLWNDREAADQLSAYRSALARFQPRVLCA